MNNPPRGTYLNKSKPNSHLTSAHIERTTVNNTSVTKQQVQKGPGQQDKMITKILDVVSRLENPTNTPALSRETLKIGSQKAFFDVLCIFFRAIDGHTQRTEFTSMNNTELMLDALRVFGYKGNYNRSLFQPVGAPHTWTQCLTILEWFSELAIYSYSFQSVLQERVFQEDQHSIILNTFNSRKEEPITHYIHNQIEHLQSQISNNSFTVESKQMAIRNQHAAQKELPLIEKELEKERELSYRAKQEAMGVEAEVKTVEMKIQAKQQELTQALQKQAQGMASLEKLRYEIIHQELPPDECEKIKLEIRDTKNKISEIQEGISETIDIQRTVNKQYLQTLTDKASVVRKLGEKLTASPLVSESDIKMQIPTLNQMDLNDLLKNSFQEWSLNLESEGKLETIFKEREFGQFFRKMEEFIAKQEARLGKEEETLVNKEQEVQSLQSKSKDFQEDIERLDKSKKAKASKSSVLQSEKHDLERSIHELEGEIHLANQEIAQKNLQRDQIMLDVKETLASLKTMEQTMKEAEQARAEIIRHAKEQIQAKKRDCLNRIENYKRSLTTIFNSDFQSKFYSQ